MDQPARRKRTLKRISRVVLKSVLFLFLFIIVIFLLVLTPPVQNVLKKKMVTYLENKLQTKVSIRKVFVGLPRKIILEDVYVEDKQKDTLLMAGSLRMNINIWKLITKGELDISKTELKNSTAKIKRQLPDTVFNFQFIVDAFGPKRDTADNLPDTAASPLALGSISLDNVRVLYNDVVTGSDMETWIDHLDTRIDNFDPQHSLYDIPETNVSGATARIYQVKPLASPEPEIKDKIEALQPSALQLGFKQVNLKNFKLDYRNDVSATYATIDVGELMVQPNKIDLDNRIIELQNASLANSILAVRLGKKEQARVVVQEVKQEVKSQSEAGWNIKLISFNLNNNSLQFDNDNNPRTASGIDYSHLKLADVTIQIDNLVLNQDSIGGQIKRAEFKEQSGFVLNELHTDVLYASNQAYLKDL